MLNRFFLNIELCVLLADLEKVVCIQKERIAKHGAESLEVNSRDQGFEV